MEKQKLTYYDVIIGRYLMKYLQMDVLNSEDAVLWDGVRPPMQKIKNGKWMDLNLMDEDDTEAIKEQSKLLGRILIAKYEKADLEQEVMKLTHLTKSQGVILLGCLKCYKALFGGNL